MDTLELIDNYIDNQLSQPEVQKLENDLQQDDELQQLLDSVIIARRAIRLSSLTLKVREVHERCIDEIKAERTKDPVRIMPVSPTNRAYSWAVRMAATVLIGIIGYSSYQYASLTPAQLYQEKFISYQLPTTRGSMESVPRLNSLYLSGNYLAVVHQFTTIRAKRPSDYFLTGISYLKQKEFKSAITTFAALRTYNKQNTEAYFDQETDYYLALAYIGANQVDESYKLFRTIHDTPRHLFHESVTDLDLIKLSLLRTKM